MPHLVLGIFNATFSNKTMKDGWLVIEIKASEGFEKQQKTEKFSF